MDFTKFKPLREIVLVRREEKKKVDGGIIVPEAWQQYGWRATVIAIGKDVSNCLLGDDILFLKEFTVLPFPEREMATTHADHILARIEVADLVEQIIPQNKFILVSENPPAKDGEGIVLVNPRQNTKSGVVYRVSKECLDVAAGQHILFDKSVAACVEDGKKYLVLDEADVLCVQET